MTRADQELRALFEVARLRAWLRALGALAGAAALAECAIAGDTWPGREAPDGHGARRTGGLR